MLDDASKYVLVDPPVKDPVTNPDGIEINGGIMPARDVADDGSWKILRGEDPCFLLEAGNRIRVYKNKSVFTSPDVPSQSIEQSDLTSAISGIHEGYYDGGTWPVRPVFKSADSSGTGWRYYRDVVETPYTSRAAIDELLTSASRSQPISSWRYSSWYNYGSGLVADRIRDMFYDLNRVKGIASSLYTTIRTATGTPRYRESPYQVVYNYDDPNHPSTPTGVSSVTETYGTWATQSSYARRIICDWERGNMGYYGNYETDFSFTIDSLDLSLPLSSNRRLSPWCVAIIPVYTIYDTHKWTWVNGTSNWEDSVESSTTYKDRMVLDGTVDVSDGLIKFGISSSVILDCATGGSRNLPNSFNAMPWAFNGSNVVTGSLLRIMLGESSSSGYNPVVMFYDDDLDFSSIGWVWPVQQGT